MHDITEQRRLLSPGPRPQPVAIDGEHLWVGAWDTQRLYCIDAATWTVHEEADAPGRPYGMTVVGDELRVVVGIGEEDDRYIYRFVPGHGFKESDRIPCPDLTGSHLAFDGDTLFLSQMGHKRILSLDAQGNVLRELPLDRKPSGMTVLDGTFYVLSGDDELENMSLMRVDAHDGTPKTQELASVPFAARGLSFDGVRFWTCHRDNNEIVAFEKP